MDNDTLTAVIVDDHRDIVDMLCEYIVMSPSKVKVVGKGYDGKEAVQLYEELKPDVILLDVNMPVYNGLYAVENIRKINPAARIVVISNSISDQVRHQLKDESIPVIDKTDELDKLRQYLENLAVSVCKT